MLLVQREGVAQVRRPQSRVLLVRHRRVVVDVLAEHLVAESDVVARVEHGGVPHVVEPLAHRDYLVPVGADQEHEALVLRRHHVEVALAVVALTVLQVQELSAQIPRGDLVPDLRLLLRHVHRGRQ